MAEAIPKHFKPKFTNETALHLVIARHYKAGGADAAMTEERCIDHLRYLIDNGPSNLVDVHTTGTFFSMALGAPNASGKPVPAGKAPYGETALNFAVCFNMPRVVEFLVKYAGADLTEGDSVNEWTPMHMAVMHGREHMLQLLENLWEEVRLACKGKETQAVKLMPGARRGITLVNAKHPDLKQGENVLTQIYLIHQSKLHQVQDGQKRTPLILAAYYGKVRVFSKLWRDQSFVEWEYAQGSCRFFPLDDVECLEASPSAEDEGTTISKIGSTLSPLSKSPVLRELAASMLPALNRQLNRQKQTAFELITLDDDTAGVVMSEPPFRELIRQKWDRYARAIFRERLVLFVLYLGVLLSLASDANSRGPSLPLRARVDQQLDTWWWGTLWVVAAVGGVGKLWMTLNDAAAAGSCARFFQAKGSTRWERLLSLAFLASGSALAAWYAGLLGLGDAWVETLFQLTPFVALGGVVWFLLGASSSARTTILVIDMMAGDFTTFLPASALFAVFFALLFNTRLVAAGARDSAPAPALGTLPWLSETLNRLSQLLGAEKDTLQKNANHDPLFTVGVNLGFQVAGLVLTNLLIAMMNSTCA